MNLSLNGIVFQKKFGNPIMDKNNGRILVTGSDGLVGSRFLELSENRDYLHTPTQVDLDLTNTGDIYNLFQSYEFRAVVNFAAFTDVGEAEKQRNKKEGLAYQVNVVGVKNLLNAVKPLAGKIQFIQISTDMVFPGSMEMKGPYEETLTPRIPTDKLTWYGFTKAEAERQVMEEMQDSATIVRMIYPVRAKFSIKTDYLRKPLKLFDEGKLYPIFSDQTISISFIDEVAKALDKIINLKLFGIYHVSSSDTGTPFEIVNYLLEKTRGVKNAVKPILLDEFIKNTGSSPLRYPKFGGLTVRKTQAKLGINFSPWRKIIDTLIAQGITS